MTKQHFTAIAQDLNFAFHRSNQNTILAVASMLADRFEGFNPHFCREKFLEAVTKP